MSTASPEKTTRRRGLLLLLLLIFFGALTPRIIGIGDQLPDVFHPDEDKEIRRALNVYRGDIDLSRTHKGGLFMVLAAEYGALYVTWRASGRVSSPEDFAVEVFRDLGSFIYLSRLTVALLGAGCAVLAFFLARHLAGRGAGIIAALLVAVHPQLIELSRWGRLDIPLTFCVLLFLFATMRAGSGRSLWRLIWAVAAAGLLVSCKSSGAPYLVAFLPAVVPWLSRHPGAGNVVKALVCFSVTGVLVVLIFNPALAGLVFGFGIDEQVQTEDLAVAIDTQYEGAFPNRVENYVITPARSVGLIGLVLAVFGVWQCLRKSHRRTSRTVPWWLLGAFLQIAMLWVVSPLVSWRYVLPALPIFIVLAAVGIVHATRWVSMRGQRVAVALGFTLLMIALYGAQSWKHLRHEWMPATQSEARKRIETHVPAGVAIALEGKDYFPSGHMPRLWHTTDSLAAAADANQETDSGKADIVRRFAIPALGKPGYAIHLYRFGDLSTLSEWAAILEEWQAQGVRYVVKRESKIATGEYRLSMDALASALDAMGAQPAPWGTLLADDETLRGVSLRVFEIPEK